MLNEKQLLKIKKEYLNALYNAINPEFDGNYRSDYNQYLKGFADALNIDFNKLESELDNHMLSDHFMKQHVNFNDKKEIYHYIKNERKALQD